MNFSHTLVQLIFLLTSQRSRRGGGGMSRRAPARAPARRPAPAPVRTQASQAPAVQQQPSAGGGMLSGLASTVAQGMAFGTGSAIAHRAVGAAAGAFSGGGEAGEGPAPQAVYDSSTGASPQAAAQLSGACSNDKQMFYECLQVNKGDQQSCSFLYDQLQSCQRNETSMSFN